LLRASVQLSRKDYALAEADADKVFALEPWNRQASLYRAQARAGEGDDSGAIQAYTELLDKGGAGRALFMPQFRDAALARARLLLKVHRTEDAQKDLAAIIDQGGLRAILRLQLFLRANGYPNVEITGTHSVVFDTALTACFSDTVCGPNLKP
jgi:hypothetical protein